MHKQIKLLYHFTLDPFQSDDFSPLHPYYIVKLQKEKTSLTEVFIFKAMFDIFCGPGVPWLEPNSVSFY